MTLTASSAWDGRAISSSIMPAWPPWISDMRCSVVTSNLTICPKRCKRHGTFSVHDLYIQNTRDKCIYKLTRQKRPPSGTRSEGGRTWGARRARDELGGVVTDKENVIKILDVHNTIGTCRSDDQVSPVICSIPLEAGQRTSYHFYICLFYLIRILSGYSC